MFGKAFRFTGILLNVCILILVVMFGIGLLRGATAEQQQALDLLAEKPAFKAEENLAPYIWLVAYDVPEDQVLVIAKSDAEIFNALTNSDAISEFHTQAKARYAYIGFLEEELKKYCRLDSKMGCVEQIEKDHAKLRPLLQDNKKMIERAEKITKFRVHYSPMEQYIQTPLPKFNAGRELMLVHYADLFLSGAQESAVEKVCGDITFWRSVGTNTDALIASMIGHAFVRMDMKLLAEMLGRMDSDEALPLSCSLALQPVNYKENMICDVMRGEFGITKNLDQSFVDEPKKSGRFGQQIAATLLYSHQQTLRKAAPFFASSCSIAAVNAAKRNQSISLNSEAEYKCDAIDWVSNFSGCQFLRVAAPDYSKYSGRRLDQSAQITAMQILLWLRDKKVNAENIETMFVGRPENLQAFSDRIHLNEISGTLKVDLLSPASDKNLSWELPLLPTMRRVAVH